MKKSLLLLFACLFGALGGVKAWTYVDPVNGRWYYLYNIGNNKAYFKGTSTSYSANTNIVEATPVKVEASGSKHKLAFLDGVTTYKIYQRKGTGDPDNTSGVDFSFDGSAGDSWGYRLTSNNGDWLEPDRYMTWNGTYLEFKKENYSNIRDWQFIAYEEVLPSIVEAKAPTCASTAEASYVSGWKRVTTKEQLAQNPERYFYAIFSAVNPGVMMTTENNRMYYKAAGNPLSSSSYDLFEMENYDGEFAIKSNITGKYYGNTSEDPWDFLANKETLNEGCKVTVTCSNGVYNLQDRYDKGQDEFVGNYLGAWDNMEFTGERLAGNKSLKRAGYFLIYRIAKEGLNMTSRIANPNLDGNLDDWQKTSEGGNGIVAASGGAESWNSSNFNFYQTLTNLPNGYYEIGVRAFYRAGDKQTTGAERNVKLYAKAEEVAVKNINQYQEQASTPGTGIWVQPTGASYYVPDNTEAANYALNTLNAYNNSVVAHVTDGTLTFGVKKETSIANDWSYWDTFTLTYLGDNHVIIDDPETKTQTYEGTFTEDVDLTPTVECPIVDITGASFTGNIDVSFAENPNGLIIATSAQKIELNYLKEDPVKNIISTKDKLSDKVVITDGYPFVAPFDFQAQEARYSRTVGASTNFGTICVPFALTSNEDIQYYTTDQITGGVLKLIEVDNVAAGTPAIFKKKNSGATSISVHKIGTAIEKDAGSQGESVRLVGKFERYVVGDEGGTTGTAANGNYFISSDVFYEGADYIIVKPFRAYLETVGVTQSRLTLQIDDETTAINELKTLDEQQGLKDGKYLIDGKIIVVKEGKQYNVNGVIK